MNTPNFEGCPFDLELTHSIALVPVHASDAEGLIASHYNVVAHGPCPYGSANRGEVCHTIGSGATYEEADAIRTPAWDVIHITRRLKNVFQ